MKQDLYEALGFAENNKKIANDYLDTTQEEKIELLNQVERQNFSVLENSQR